MCCVCVLHVVCVVGSYGSYVLYVLYVLRAVCMCKCVYVMSCDVYVLYTSVL